MVCLGGLIYISIRLNQRVCTCVKQKIQFKETRLKVQMQWTWVCVEYRKFRCGHDFQLRTWENSQLSHLASPSQRNGQRSSIEASRRGHRPYSPSQASYRSYSPLQASFCGYSPSKAGYSSPSGGNFKSPSRGNFHSPSRGNFHSTSQAGCSSPPWFGSVNCPFGLDDSRGSPFNQSVGSPGFYHFPTGSPFRGNQPNRRQDTNNNVMSPPGRHEDEASASPIFKRTASKSSGFDRNANTSTCSNRNLTQRASFSNSANASLPGSSNGTRVDKNAHRATHLIEQGSTSSVDSGRQQPVLNDQQNPSQDCYASPSCKRQKKDLNNWRDMFERKNGLEKVL